MRGLMLSSLSFTDRGLRLAEIIGISLGIVFGTCIFVLTMLIAYLAIRRGSYFASVSSPVYLGQQQLHGPQRFTTSPFSPYGMERFNPVYQADGLDSYYWGPNRQNVSARLNPIRLYQNVVFLFLVRRHWRMLEAIQT